MCKFQNFIHIYCLNFVFGTGDLPGNSHITTNIKYKNAWQLNYYLLVVINEMQYESIFLKIELKILVLKAIL